jgi:chromosome segregation ATPase
VADRTAELKQRRQDLDDEIRKANGDIAIIQEKMERRSKRREETIAEMEKNYNATVKTLDSDLNKKLERLKIEYEMDVAKAKQEHKKKLEKSKQDHEKVTESYCKKIDEIMKEKHGQILALEGQLKKLETKSDKLDLDFYTQFGRATVTSFNI